MKDYLQNRQRAMAWVNSAKHDFAEGIAILKDASFKPGVVSVLARHGSGTHQSDERLMYHMRSFIRCYANEEETRDTDLSLDVIDGKKIAASKPENLTIPSMLSKETKDRLDSKVYPEPIAKVIIRYREAYVQRDKLMRQLADLPETNDDKTVEKRRNISDRMKKLSDTMDKLYPQYAAYIAKGEVPTAGVGDKGNIPSLDKMNKGELQKQRKSVATKILRARNMLLYQTETKQEKENPLKDEKKVAKYNAKIERLTAELKNIDMAIAALA